MNVRSAPHSAARPRRPVAVLALVALALLGGARDLRAQVIRGSVIDSDTGSPVSTANVTLLTLGDQRVRQLISDSAGRFQVEAPRAGRYVLVTERIGYRSTRSAPFDVVPPDTLTVIMRIAVDVIELEPFEIVGERDALVLDPRLTTRGFYDRRARFTKGSGVSHFMDYEAIKARYPMRATDLFRNLSGVYVVSRGGSRGPMITGRRGCSMTVYIDGVLLRGGAIDAWVPATSLAAVEVYPRAPYPAQYAPRDARCGSIVIWTGWVEGKGRGG